MSDFDSDHNTDDDRHALLRAVIRLETKVDLMLTQQKETRNDIAHIESRLRDTENRIVSLETDRNRHKTWPNVVAASVAGIALLISFVQSIKP